MSTNRRPIERFMEKVSVSETGCWEWTAYASKGYGRFTFNDRGAMAHRWSYEYHVGPIPAGLVIDHLCRNTRCVNPSHLEPVTNAENIRRGIAAEVKRAWAAARTHCNRGHEYTPANTYTNGEHRTCLTCKRDAGRRHYERNRELYIQKAAEWTRANPERARELTREGQRRYRARRTAA